MAVAARCSLHVSASRPLRPNVTSFIKPEVHNVAQRRQRRTEPRQRGSAHRTSRRSVQRFQRYARGQTDRHTDRRVDHNTPHRYWGGVIKPYVRPDWYIINSCSDLICFRVRHASNNRYRGCCCCSYHHCHHRHRRLTTAIQETV